MKRRVLPILTLISLLLFVATVVIWIRSYWVGNVYSSTNRDDERATVTMYLLRAERGVVVIVRGRQEFRNGIPIGSRWALGLRGSTYAAPPEDPPHHSESPWNRLGF